MYVVIEPMQSGTFSTVYRAWDRRGQRYVAMKVIPTEKYSDEIETMQLLGARHPNICSMLDFYVDETNHILVLEFCALGDLCDFVELSRRGSERARPIDLCRMVKQLLSAVSYAHSLGIAHRDIKPENILLTGDGAAKLADWGHSVQTQWSNDTNVGTDAYRSPETFFGHRYDNFKADYWSFGLTLLYAAFGKTPFRCAKNSDGTTNPYPNCCANFAAFALDPHQFMYEFYLKPLPESPASSPANNNSSFLPIFHIIHLCTAVVDHLVNIDPGKRSLDEFQRVIQSSGQKSESVLQLESLLRLPTFLQLKN